MSAFAATARRRTSSWSLRRRLLVSVVAIFVILTSAIAIASVVSMRAVLMDRLDGQVRDAVTAVGDAVRQGCLEDAGLPSGTDATVPKGTIAVLTRDDEPMSVQIFDTSSSNYLPDSSVQALIDETSQSSSLGSLAVSTSHMGGTIGEVRVASIALSDVVGDIPCDTSGVQMYVAIPLTDVNTLIGALVFVIGISVIIAALALVALGDALIRRSLRPLTNVIATTERISQLPLDSGEVQLSNRVAIDDAATEVGRVSESVNRMLEHIESSLESRAASERKVRQFVADASHELRTPLAAVQGYAEITRKHEAALSDEAQLSLSRIEAAAGRMSSLVNDLLLLARLDEGRELDHEVVDLSLLIIDAVADAQAAGPEHPLALELPEEPVEVLGDLLRLQQVVANLLANARIHTPEGTHVDVRLHVGEGDDAGLAIVEIADAGPGIDPALQSTLFERFVRGDASRSRAAGSSGLGLAIVRAIVEAHGGTIALRSEPGDTTFTLRIPLAPDDLRGDHDDDHDDDRDDDHDRDDDAASAP